MQKYWRYLILLAILGWAAWSYQSQTAPENLISSSDQAASPTPTQINSGVLGEKQYAEAPASFLKPENKYWVSLETNYGPILIELFHQEVPVAANNFAFLAKDGFYDGLSFHRVIEGFMIQGGDPKGDGTGGPGYQFADEPITREYKRGMVAYANSGPNTNGSQFFIVHQDVDLPKQYVIFGQVAEGLDNVDKIAQVPVKESRFGEQSEPLEPVTIEKAELLEQ